MTSPAWSAPARGPGTFCARPLGRPWAPCSPAPANAGPGSPRSSATGGGPRATPARDARALRRLRRFDYGLAYSLREAVARDEHRYYNSHIDEQGQVARLQDRLLAALEEFFDARGVDTSDLTDRRRTIVNNITSYLFGDVVGDNVAIGTNSRAGDGRERPPGAGGGTSPPGGRRPSGPAGPDKPKDGTAGS